MSNLATASAALKQQVIITPQANQNTATPSMSKWDRQRALMLELQTAIKAERNSQGLTQRQLARKSGMSQGTITRAEVHGWVSISTMLTIIDALGKTIKVV